MGTVHGVYLKYVGLSAVSYAGYRRVMMLANQHHEQHQHDHDIWSLIQQNHWLGLAAAALGYSAVVNGSVAAMFRLKRGMNLIGKDPVTGRIPLWSYVVWAPFHLPTWFYTWVSHKKDKHPPATEVHDNGWYVGGRYAHEMTTPSRWTAIVDLTVEFPESCRDRTDRYLSLPAWDGVPAPPQDLERAAVFLCDAMNAKGGPVLVHCAHGKGRSTTVAVAALVRAGLYPSWEEAFEKGVRPRRTCCKLNAAMRASLTAWQKEYVDDKKKGE